MIPPSMRWAAPFEAVLADIVTIMRATSSGRTKRWIREVGSSTLK
jgi:hypothetical protein